MNTPELYKLPKELLIKIILDREKLFRTVKKSEWDNYKPNLKCPLCDYEYVSFENDYGNINLVFHHHCMYPGCEIVDRLHYHCSDCDYIGDTPHSHCDKCDWVGFINQHFYKDSQHKHCDKCDYVGDIYHKHCDECDRTDRHKHCSECDWSGDINKHHSHCNQEENCKRTYKHTNCTKCGWINKPGPYQPHDCSNLLTKLKKTYCIKNTSN